MKSVFKKRVFSTSYRVYRLIKLTEIINDISMFNSSVDHVTYGLNFVSRKKEKKRGGHIIMSHQFDPIPRKQPLLIYIHHYDYK